MEFKNKNLLDDSNFMAGKNMVIHICNVMGKWGRGFVLPLSKKWKDTREKYIKLAEYELGHVQYVEVADNIVVANMICQHGINIKNQTIDRVDYDALHKCLIDISNRYGDEFTIHMPKIGCGLACGNFEKILELIQCDLRKFKKIMYII